ncbi:MAG: T9SS type A sorting domain-containing protein, partial [Melioribacteraceae bacterium]|nr:T9SS type A sorting domain-containing protein [Melioribacteraceae bacterium]
VVYNVIGEVVEKLVDNKMVAGRHQVEFDASHLSSGIYFYRLNAGTFVDVKKMMIIK